MVFRRAELEGNQLAPLIIGAPASSDTSQDRKGCNLMESRGRHSAGPWYRAAFEKFQVQKHRR